MLLGFLGGSSKGCLNVFQIRFSGNELLDQYQTDTEPEAKFDAARIPQTCLYVLQIRFSG